MALGILASIGIPFITDMISKYGEKAVTAGVEKVTGVDLTKKELTPQDKQAIIDAEIQLKRLDFEELKLQYEDVKRASNMNIAIQDSENASTLAKNAAYIIDFMIVGATILLGAALFAFNIPTDNKELAYMMFGGMMTYCGTVINFHRSSSAGSKQKAEDMAKAMKGKM